MGKRRRSWGGRTRRRGQLVGEYEMGRGGSEEGKEEEYWGGGRGKERRRGKEGGQSDLVYL